MATKILLRMECRHRNPLAALVKESEFVLAAGLESVEPVAVGLGPELAAVEVPEFE